MSAEPPFVHRIRGDAWSTSYWQGNRAADFTEADKANVEMDGTHAVISFALPRQRVDLENLQRALKVAFEAGKKARSREVLALISDGSRP